MLHGMAVGDKFRYARGPLARLTRGLEAPEIIRRQSRARVASSYTWLEVVFIGSGAAASAA